MTTSAISPDRVSAELRLYDHIKQQLRAEIADLDEETLSDTLDGATNLKDLLAEVLRSSLEDEAYAGALRARIGDMKDRLARLERRAEAKRDLTLRALASAGIPKLTSEDFTAFVRQGTPALEVLHEAEIPEQFWKPQPPKLDRQALITALRADVAISGARLAPPKYQLNVRTK